MSADGSGIRLTSAYDSASTICAKTFSTYVRVTVTACYVLAADVFGTGMVQ